MEPFAPIRPPPWRALDSEFTLRPRAALAAHVPQMLRRRRNSGDVARPLCAIIVIRVNKLFWIAAFCLGAAVFAWSQWRGGEVSAMGWFIETSVWSAVCGIGYTLCEWFAGRGRRSPSARDEDDRA